MRAPGRVPAALAGLLMISACALAGCSGAASASTTTTQTQTPTPAATSTAAPRAEAGGPDGVRVIPDLVYGEAGGQRLLLDACLPKASKVTSSKPKARAAIVMIHGGSWTRGDKAAPAYRAVCTWLASHGYPTFAVDYRLDPQFIYPAALDDVRTAVTWLRDSAQRSRFNIDPRRIGAFGGSAGANLAALLATSTTGPLTGGSRVAAVVDLSGPVDLTGADVRETFVPVQLAYLGCASEADCPNARAASPIYAVSADDPPFFIVNSSQELIPVAQSRRLADALDAVGVPATFVEVPGGLHSIAMLSPSLRSRILSFYASTLGTAAPASASAD